jgi:hypothetical protein
MEGVGWYRRMLEIFYVLDFLELFEKVSRAGRP